MSLLYGLLLFFLLQVCVASWLLFLLLQVRGFIACCCSSCCRCVASLLAVVPPVAGVWLHCLSVVIHCFRCLWLHGLPLFFHASFVCIFMACRCSFLLQVSPMLRGLRPHIASGHPGRGVCDVPSAAA